MDLTDLLQNPFVAAIVGLFAPLIFTLFPGLGALLKIFPKSFWEAAGKAVGFTVTWPSAVAAQSLENLRQELAQLRSTEGWHDPSTATGRVYDDKSREYSNCLASSAALPKIDGSVIQQWLPIIAIVGAVIFFTTQQGGCKKPTPPTPATSSYRSSVTPAADLTAAAAPIRAIAAKNPEAAKRVGKLYAAIADVLRRDGVKQRLTTTGQLREYLTDSDSLYIAGTDLAGALPGFGAAKDGVLDVAVGNRNNAAFTSDIRERVAQGLDAVSLALGA